jgi:hypothetical protein
MIYGYVEIQWTMGNNMQSLQNKIFIKTRIVVA